MPPVLGAGLLIWGGINSTSFVHGLLSTTAFTSIGKASYSLYLWHWPLLVFARYAYGETLSTAASILTCVIALLLSFVSLWYVEKPFRFPSPTRHRFFVATAVSGAVVVAIAGGLIQMSAGLPYRLDMTSKGYLDAERDKDSKHIKCMSLEEFILPPSNACRIGAANVEPSALLWGDSHAMVTAIAAERAATKNGKSFLFAASADCPIGLGFGIDQKIGPAFVGSSAYHYCEQYNSNMLKLAQASPNIKTVILSSRWTNWRIGEPGAPSETPVDIRLYDETGSAQSKDQNKEIFERGFVRLIKSLLEAGKTVWIVGPLPEPSARIPKALYVKHLGFNDTDLDVPKSNFLKKNAWILKLFEKVGATYQVRFIWPHSVLCDDRTCPVSQNDQALFFDDNHLSIRGVEKTAPLYDLIFEDN